MLELMKQAALEAGADIMQVYATDFTVFSKADESPLTEADLRADRRIRSLLSMAYPQAFIWSEESVSEQLGPVTEFFLVDPLDGTKEFLKRTGEFTVNIAWVVKGLVELAVVYVPVLDALFYARRGQGAWLQTRASERLSGSSSQGENLVVAERLTVRKPLASEVLKVIGSRSHGLEELTQWLEQLNRPHVLVNAGSSLKFCRIAQGLADLYPRFGPTCQWDTAAGQGILEGAGGTVMDFEGNPLRYGLDRPVLNPDFVALACESLR